MRGILCIFTVILFVSALPQTTPAAVVPDSSRQMYAGSWWEKSDADERSGFLNGVSDCMTWTAHRKGFNATPEQLMGRVSKFYEMHPDSVDLSVVDVWQRIEGAFPTSGVPGVEGGERWKNAHWYLNDDWWIQSSEDEQLGFVEGYLWCMKTEVPAPAEGYSGTAASYRRRIEAFAKAHPKQGKEAVAMTLRRYRDRTK